jgi:hypothetical protein
MSCTPAGSVNDTSQLQNQLEKYAVPDLCVGEFSVSDCQDTYQESIAAEAMNRSGATINIFKLLGVHEQGKMLDVTGSGRPLNGSAFAFDALAPTWVSPQVGTAVTQAPAWLGYDFGVRSKTYVNSQLQVTPAYLPELPNLQVISSFRITQPTAGARALQVRIDSSNGEFYVDPTTIQYAGTGNGLFSNFTAGTHCNTGALMLTALSATTFSVFYTGNNTLLGVATVGQRFNSLICSFNLAAGSIPFVINDMFTVPISMKWHRVDVVNLLDNAAPQLVSFKQSAGARYWRIVPTMFVGTGAWEVEKVEFFNLTSTRLDTIQDHLFMENRDREYATTSIDLKVAYTPIEAISNLGKFGFDIGETYVFTAVFAQMVQALGRPLVIGDILEIPSERQYDTNLMPVRKFIEVTDTNWAADGYTTSWRPIIFKFQGQPAIASQETRDLFGTLNNRFSINDLDFANGMQSLQTQPITSTEINTQEAIDAVPKKGTDGLELASGTNRFRSPGSYDGNQMYVADAIPADGQTYEEGFKLPTPAISIADRTFFRLIYDPALKIPAKLYQFDASVMKWKWVETDQRQNRSSFKPSQKTILGSSNVPLSSKL